MGAQLPPIDLASLNQARLGVAPPTVWPSQGAAVTFNWASYGPAGTALDSVAGWSRVGGAVGAVSINSSGGLDTSSAQDVMYSYDIGNSAHSIEANFTTGGTLNFPVCVKVIDTSNFIGVRCNSGPKQIEVYQRVGGTFTSLIAVTTQQALPPTDIYRIEARSDDTIALYCENLLIGTAAIPAALAQSTKIGVMIHGGTTANIVGPWSVYAGPILHGYPATGAWCWFGEPRAVSSGGKTWIGYTTLDEENQAHGAIRVLQVDHTSGATAVYSLITGINWGDDHNNPSIMLRPDGRLVIFYCEHSDVNGIRYRISVNPYDVTAFGAENIFAVPAAGGVCYPSAFMLSAESNKVYVFFRDGDSNHGYVTSADMATVAAPASDGAAQTAATWSALQCIVPNPGNTIAKGVYSRMTTNYVDRIDIATTFAFQSQAGIKIDVRHAFMKGGVAYASSGKALGRLTSTSATVPVTTTMTAASGATSITVASATGIVAGMSVLSNGYVPSGVTVASVSGTTVTLAASSYGGGSFALSQAASATSVTFLPYTFATLTPIATSGAPDNLGDTWVHDVARDTNTGIVYCVFAQFLSVTKHQYWYARWDGVQWNKVAISGATTGSLTPAATTTEGYYSPGVILDEYTPGLVYASLGNAAGTACSLYRYVTPDGGASWTRQAISPPPPPETAYSGQDFRPYVPVNRDRRCGVVWLRGSYNFYNWDATLANATNGGAYHAEIMSASV